MTLNEFLTITALVFGPLVGIRVQTWIEDRKKKRNKREGVFKTLMITRGTALSPKHVEALNAIDIEFTGLSGADRKVRDAWKAYLDHLNDPAIQDPKVTDDIHRRWTDKTADLLAKLLHEMSLAVGYDFDETYIKRAAYTPRRYSDVELDHDAIRRLMVQVLAGQRALPVTFQGAGVSEDQQKLTKLLIEHYEGHRPAQVRIVQDDTQSARKLIADATNEGGGK